MLKVRGLCIGLRPHPGAARRRSRGRGGRDRHPDRRQWRRQDDAADDAVRQAARASAGSITFEGEELTGLPTYQIVRRGIAHVAGRPPHLPAHERARKSADGRRGHGPDPFQGGSRAGARPVPTRPRAAEAARRHAVGRRAADAGDRPRADGPAQLAAARRAVAGPRADDRAPDFRDHPRDQCASGSDRLAGRAECLPRADASPIAAM